MSDQKTIESPVDSDMLTALAQLQADRARLSERAVDLDLERMKTLRVISDVDAQRTRVFAQITSERGIPDGHPIQIDGTTGAITLLAPLPAAPTEAAVEG